MSLVLDYDDTELQVTTIIKTRNIESLQFEANLHAVNIGGLKQPDGYLFQQALISNMRKDITINTALKH